MPPPPKIPIVSEWLLPNGFGSADLSSGRLATFPAEVGYANGVFHAVQPHSFLMDLEARFHVPATVGAQVLFDEPILALRLPTQGRALIHHDTHPLLEEAPETWNMALVAKSGCKIDHMPGDEYRCLIAVLTVSRLRSLLDHQRCPEAVERFLAGHDDSFGAAARTTSRLHRIAGEIRQNPYQGAMAALYTEGKTYELLAEALAILDTRDERQGRVGARDRQSALAARDLIMDNLASPLPIETVAQQVGLSQRRLTDLFRALFGAPPFQCLTQWRLEAAQSLLDRGDFSVKQVSYAMGYAHVSSFTQAFVRQFGYPPRSRRHRAVPVP